MHKADRKKNSKALSCTLGKQEPIQKKRFMVSILFLLLGTTNKQEKNYLPLLSPVHSFASEIATTAALISCNFFHCLTCLSRSPNVHHHLRRENKGQVKALPRRRRKRGEEGPKRKRKRWLGA